MTALPAWDVARLVARERSSPPASDDAPRSAAPTGASIEETWSDDEIAAVVAIDRRAWLARVESMRLHVEAARAEAERARATPLVRGLSPIEHGRIMREAARWKRYDNGRRCDASEAPLLTSSAREVLHHLVEFVNWTTRERDTTLEILRQRTGYKNKRTITRALRELEALGLFERLEIQRVRVRLAFANAEELRALLERAASRRAVAPRKAPAAAPAKPTSQPRVVAVRVPPESLPAPAAKSLPAPSPEPESGPCLSTSLLLGSVPELRAPHGRAELSRISKPRHGLQAAPANQNETCGAAFGGRTSSASPGAATPHKVPPSAARLTTALSAPGRDESHQGKESTMRARPYGESEAPKGSVPGPFPADASTGQIDAAVGLACLLARLDAIDPRAFGDPTRQAPPLRPLFRDERLAPPTAPPSRARTPPTAAPRDGARRPPLLGNPTDADPGSRYALERRARTTPAPRP